MFEAPGRSPQTKAEIKPAIAAAKELLAQHPDGLFVHTHMQEMLEAETMVRTRGRRRRAPMGGGATGRVIITAGLITPISGATQCDRRIRVTYKQVDGGG